MAKTDKKHKRDKKDAAKKSDPIKQKSVVSSSKEILAKAAALAKSTGSKKLRTNGKKSSDSSSAEESSSEESDSSEEVSPPVKPIPTSVKKPESSSDDSSDASSSEESLSEKGDTRNKGKVSTPVKATPAAVQKAASASDSSSDASSEDSDNDEEMASVPAKTSPGKGKKASDSEDDSSDESSSKESSSGSESDEEMNDKASASAQIAPIETYKKRKADNEAVAVPKKVKLANEGASSVSSEETKSIFIGQLSWNVDNDWLAQEFAECGQVESAHVQMDRNTGRSRGFGYVHFKTIDALEKALALDGKEIDGRAVRIDKSNPRDKKTSMEKRAQTFGDVTSPPSAVLFVGNLSFGVNEDTLWETFGDHGDIKSIRVPTDRDSGRPKGFAYVEFSDIGSAKKAHGALQGFELDGRSIRLDYSQPRDNTGGRGGGQGGRGGWGGRGQGRGGFGGDRGRGAGRGFRGGRGGRGGERGGRGGGRNPRTGGIAQFEGQKITF